MQIKQSTVLRTGAPRAQARPQCQRRRGDAMLIGMSPRSGNEKPCALADPTRSILGTFVSGGVTSLEILAWSGFDLVCIETEHAARDVGEVASLIRAADACGVPSLVRVQDLSEIGRVLDAGADGVVIPHVDTADDARACVEAVQYPPRGNRGLGPGRAARHGLGRNGDAGPPATVLMIESARAVENAKEIASVDGVDALFIGPFDLASSMGVTPGTDDHTAAITRAIQDCVSRRAEGRCLLPRRGRAGALGGRRRDPLPPRRRPPVPRQRGSLGP